MTFTFHTSLDQRAMTAMARTLRKTVRKKRSRRSHIFGWIVFAVGLLLTLTGSEGIVVDVRAVVTWLVLLVLLAVLIWEDRLNGYVARKRMLPGMEAATAYFEEESYRTETGVGETVWHYENIALPVKTREYYVFVFSANHAQIYDRSSLSGGTEEAFEKRIEAATGKTFQVI